MATVAELAAARPLSARGALVRYPSTIEALRRVIALCFDKTGTLTEGRIALRIISDGEQQRKVSEFLSPTRHELIAVVLCASPYQVALGEVTHERSLRFDESFGPVEWAFRTLRIAP